MSTTAPASLEQVVEAVKRLSTADQLRLQAELETILHEQAMASQPKRSIMEFKGLGKEMWRQIDTTAYIQAERDSWD